MTTKFEIIFNEEDQDYNILVDGQVVPAQFGFRSVQDAQEFMVSQYGEKFTGFSNVVEGLDYYSTAATESKDDLIATLESAIAVLKGCQEINIKSGIVHIDLQFHL